MWDEGDEEYEQYEQDEQEANAKSFAEALKQHLCAQIDSHAERFITEEREEREAVKELAQLTSMLSFSGNPTAARGHLPLTDRVQALIQEIGVLRKQIKETDEMLLAKRHYLPLVQSLVKDAQERGDQYTVNKINEFLISGRII